MEFYRISFIDRSSTIAEIIFHKTQLPRNLNFVIHKKTNRNFVSIFRDIYNERKEGRGEELKRSNFGDDLLEGEGQPLVEGDGPVAVLVHLGEHLVSRKKKSMLKIIILYIFRVTKDVRRSRQSQGFNKNLHS